MCVRESSSGLVITANAVGSTGVYSGQVRVPRQPQDCRENERVRFERAARTGARRERSAAAAVVAERKGVCGAHVVAQ